MTDQRPIDPSTLRDGDIVRAKRGEHGVVEGVFHSYPISSGWGIGSEAEEDGLFAWNDKGWTITAILRPVLVKGDRVKHQPCGKRVLIVIDVINSDLVMVVPEENRYVASWDVRTADLTRLPAAPEPAPIEVGDWWTDEGGWPCVVVKIGPTGNPFLRRWTSEHPDKAPSPETLRAAWTRLDGPPEPPVGSVYVIRGTVWESTNEGHWRVGMEGVDLWPEVQAYYDKVDLATLQIVHTLEVE